MDVMIGQGPRTSYSHTPDFVTDTPETIAAPSTAYAVDCKVNRRLGMGL